MHQYTTETKLKQHIFVAFFNSHVPILSMEFISFFEIYSSGLIIIRTNIILRPVWLTLSYFFIWQFVTSDSLHFTIANVNLNLHTLRYSIYIIHTIRTFL